MIVRYETTCPGCVETILVRVSVFPTELLRYYILCPVCGTPIRGTMEGHELQTFDLRIESGFRSSTEGDFPTVTVDPLIPMNPAATALDELGGGPNLTIFQLAGSEQRAVRLSEHAELVYQMHLQIPKVRRALEYYEHGKDQQFWTYLKNVDLLDDGDSAQLKSADQAAHKLWTIWLLKYAQAIEKVAPVANAAQAYARWHNKAMKNARYAELMTEAVDDGESKKLTRGLIAATRSLMSTAAAWRAGYLSHGLPASAQLGNLKLLQDEFDGLRDCYQRVFEACCSSLWPIIYAYNAVVEKDPENFNRIHYQKKNDPRTYSINSIGAFHKLPNAFKLEIISQIPGMGDAFAYLDNATRNAIGHATAHLDLREGTIVNDENQSKSYLNFVGEVYALTGPLALCVAISDALSGGLQKP